MSGKATAPGNRDSFQIDRDRVLYSMPFRRLAGVTQVVSPGEGEIFHNRLTHSLKVAQIARRFAENLRREHRDIVELWGGLDPEVAEAAALAHDLGHPPFGHVAEEELDHLVAAELHGGEDKIPKEDRVEGYEGNAQTFRIITELAVRRPEAPNALDLTRATLNATLKYPWKWLANPAKKKKYGAYDCDAKAFDFAREGTRNCGDKPEFARSLEAQIMDWSDDIAYSVHDTEDFYRAGLIPLDRLASTMTERDKFQEYVTQQAQEEEVPIDGEFTTHFNRLFSSPKLKIREPYSGTRDQQELVYDFMSSKIDEFASATSLVEPSDKNGEALTAPKRVKLQVFFLKKLIWYYVIDNPSLAAQQLGQRRAIHTLFTEYNHAVCQRRWALFPPFFRDLAIKLYEVHLSNGDLPATLRVRLVSDTISSMTDRQAMLVYQRFTGISHGSVLDPVVR